MHCTHTWTYRDRHDWIFVFLSILVYFTSIRSTWHLCWLQFINQIPNPRTVNWMHFSFYFIKPNQFVICSCRCLLLLLLDCCFLRHFSLNTTARILIFSIALTWLICCGSATICKCISLWVCSTVNVYVCWGHFCMTWPFIAVHRAVGYANLQVHASFAGKTLW